MGTVAARAFGYANGSRRKSRRAIRKIAGLLFVSSETFGHDARLTLQQIIIRAL